MILKKQLTNNLAFSAEEKTGYQKTGVGLIEKMFPMSIIEYGSLTNPVEANH